MKLIEDLNNIINEALGWDTESEEYKQMMEQNKSICEAFTNNCDNLNFVETDRRKLKDGTDRISYLKFEKEGNYKHTISLEALTKNIRYHINMDIKEFKETYPNIDSADKVNEVFNDISKTYERYE